ncbi:hypothetical protein PR202_gb12518 [Eleusine coracana subsp. coracana]|uniref:Thioredoxin domain-containing protein n=1 Tax=Eleusine coracana subsp. coracana TaxID=191504 RepID=A0AAV5EQ81_ELECO|nr:hypothetical protein PR202_gb12518 [Eleusine coracana subsp. coracana]
MASEVGQVIACHTKADFDSLLNGAKESGKLLELVAAIIILQPDNSFLNSLALQVVIDFTASWCGPCRFIAPVFVDLAKKFTNAIFVKVDVDELKEVAAEYKIEAMPSFIFIKNGNKVDTIVGARKEEILAKVEQHAATASA